ncbi:MAG: YxeA family protein [Lachnospiraceae bacterium]|nr:YxeA family protein [Ruminococcus sp.]MCM1275375.1 YxeA family protein [Lachnospiraceae bacterium]
MKKTIIAVCATIVFILGAIFLVSSFIFGSYVYYYAQIDNSKYSITHQRGNVYYSYILPSCDADGNTADMAFNTTRELRGDAFLKLKTSRAAGVVDWEEVQWDELPEGVRDFFEKFSKNP